MMENGEMVRKMVMEPTTIPLVINMLVNGKVERRMVEAHSTTAMELSTRENGIETQRKEKET